MSKRLQEEYKEYLKRMLKGSGKIEETLSYKEYAEILERITM